MTTTSDQIEFRGKHLDSIGFDDGRELSKLDHYKYFIWAPNQIEWNKIAYLIGTTTDHAEQVAMVRCTPPEHLDNVLLHALKATYDTDIIVEEILKQPSALSNKMPTAAIYHILLRGRCTNKAIERIASIISDRRAQFKQGTYNTILGLICKFDGLERTKPIYDAIVSSKFFDWRRCNCHLKFLECLTHIDSASDMAVLLKQDFNLAQDQNKCLWRALRHNRDKIANLILHDKRICCNVNKSRLLLAAAARYDLTTFYRYIFFQKQPLSRRAATYLFNYINRWQVGQYAVMRDPSFLSVLIECVFSNNNTCILSNPIVQLCESLGAREKWCCKPAKRILLKMQYHFIRDDVYNLASLLQSLRLPILLQCHLAELICEPLSNSIPFGAFWTICAAVETTTRDILLKQKWE